MSARASCVLYKDHPDYAGEVDHVKLFRELDTYDGWILHTASTTLLDVMCCGMAAKVDMDEVRIMAWVKPFAAFKANVGMQPDDELVDLFPGTGAVTCSTRTATTTQACRCGLTVKQRKTSDERPKWLIWLGT